MTPENVLRGGEVRLDGELVSCLVSRDCDGSLSAWVRSEGTVDDWARAEGPARNEILAAAVLDFPAEHGNYLAREGFVLAAMNDHAHRRGIWFKMTHREDGTHAIELRGGREGHDARVVLREGEVLIAPDLLALWDVLDRAAWVVEECFFRDMVVESEEQALLRDAQWPRE